MHELSVCQALMTQLEQIAAREGAIRIERVCVQIGPLSGLEPELLRQAFSIARAGSLAGDAHLDLELMPLRVRCRSCGAESDAEPRRLVCAACGDYRTQVIAGDELLLSRVELTRATH